MNDQLDTEAPDTGQLSRYWAPLLVYAGVIFYLSSLSHPEDFAPPVFKQVSDKVFHTIEYGLLGILCYRAFRYAAGSWGMRYALPVAIVAAAVYGLTDEFHQLFVPFRQADALDLLMDLLGAAIGALSWQWVNERSGEAERRMSVP